MAMLISSVSWADDAKKQNAGEGKTAASEATQGVDVARTALGLARYGDQAKDVLALVTAARMLKTVAAKASDAKREADSGEAGKKEGGDKYTVDAILARATALAGDRADYKALIEDVKSAGARGATYGARRWTSVVSTRSRDRYRVTFEGGKAAAFYVDGDGDSDLDLYVYDENGNLICRDTDATDTMLCRWTPAWTGVFVIEIRNLGVANRYVAMHN
jgi:hypothetical protein